MAMIKLGTPYPAPGVTLERFGKTDMLIPYSIDGERETYYVRVPLEDYTPFAGEEAVKKMAASQTALKGKEFTL